MNMTSRAELSLETSHARIVSGALSPEMTERIPKTKIMVESDDRHVLVKIEADDHNSLRAALNSYIRWMSVAEETAKEALGK
jgi:tRNA threonylcarbamoyladenosine modification (KEOPS) complex  Pcc1 subunit